MESARGAMGRGKRRKASVLSSPFPSHLGRALFLSPQPPHNTKRPLRRREVDSATGLPNCSFLVLRTGVMT